VVWAANLPHRVTYAWPFFSSWDKTEAVSFFASVVVGLLSLLRIFDASVESLLDDFFFAY